MGGGRVGGDLGGVGGRQREGGIGQGREGKDHGCRGHLGQILTPTPAQLALVLVQI